MPTSRAARTHIEAGLRAHRAGEVESAAACYRLALACDPGDPSALDLLGAALLQLGNPEAALPHLERAVQRQRTNPGLLGNLAQAYFALARYEEARETFRKAARADPRQAQFQLGMANSLAMQGRLAEAESLLQRAVQRFPRDPLAWFNYGNVLRDLGRIADALPNFRRAVELAPEFVDARNNFAAVLHNLQRFGEAEAQFRLCIELAPDHLLARCNLASVLIDVARFAEAEAICREVIRADPGMSVAHTYLGAALGHQGRLRDALESHRRAAELPHEDAKVLETYAAALADFGDFAESLRSFCRAFTRSPPSVAARQMLASVLRARGCVAEGWNDYIQRPARLDGMRDYGNLVLATELPEELQDMHVCLLREQGLGDELYFLRWARVLKSRGARVSYRASNKIRSLLTRLPCIDAVYGETDPLPPADHYLLVGDLPRALCTLPSSALPLLQADAYRQHMIDFPARIAAFWPPLPAPLPLVPLDEPLARMRERLAQAGPPPYIAVTWRSGTAPQDQQGMTWVLSKVSPIDRLAAALAQYPGTALAVQRRPAPGEIDAFLTALGRPLHDFSACNEDLESMLALLTLVDEYVGVSNTNMHLRAGVGKITRVLVPSPPEWRWMQAGRYSPWFPGFPVYRQSLQGDWSAALTMLADDLAVAGTRGTR